MRPLCLVLCLSGSPALSGVFATCAHAQEGGAAYETGYEPTEAAFARKDRSEAILAEQGVPVDTKLPPIIDARQALPRDHEAVVRRTLAVLVTAVKGEGAQQATIEALLDEFGVREDLSPDETDFVANPVPPTFDRIQFAWRYEAAWAFLWALSLVEELNPPREIVNPHRIGKLVRGETVDSLMAKSALRPLNEILDQADLIYRYRRALADTGMGGQDMPAGLDPGIALERHRALNWLIGNLGRDWDNVLSAR